MTFTEVVNEVLSIVKRPDKINDIRREVNNAINFVCVDTTFQDDLEETLIAINPNAYAQNFSLTLLTRFRKFLYVKPEGNPVFVEPLRADKILAKGVELVNKYYIAGTQVNFKLGMLVTNLEVGYYQYPPKLTDASPDFWLLEKSPYMIIERAAAKIFANIGDDASSRRHEGYFISLYESARRDFGISTQ